MYMVHVQNYVKVKYSIQPKYSSGTMKYSTEIFVTPEYEGQIFGKIMKYLAR